MNPAPLFSIVIPTFQRPSYLKLALQSVVGQSYTNLEIIVRDNASNDETEDVVKSFHDIRIVYQKAAQTIPIVDNFNKALYLASGTYALFLSDDDLLSENYVSRAVNILESDVKIAGVYGGTKVIDKDGIVTESLSADYQSIASLQYLVEKWCLGQLPLISTISFATRTKTLRQLGGLPRFERAHNSDNALMVGISTLGEVVFCDDIYFFYRKYTNNSWAQFSVGQRRLGDWQFLKWLDELIDTHVSRDKLFPEWNEVKPLLINCLANAFWNNVVEYNLNSTTRKELMMELLFRSPSVYGWKRCCVMIVDLIVSNWRPGLRARVGRCLDRYRR